MSNYCIFSYSELLVRDEKLRSLGLFREHSSYFFSSSPSISSIRCSPSDLCCKRCGYLVESHLGGPLASTSQRRYREPSAVAHRDCSPSARQQEQRHTYYPRRTSSQPRNNTLSRTEPFPEPASPTYQHSMHQSHRQRNCRFSAYRFHDEVAAVDAGLDAGREDSPPPTVPMQATTDEEYSPVVRAPKRPPPPPRHSRQQHQRTTAAVNVPPTAMPTRLSSQPARRPRTEEEVAARHQRHRALDAILEPPRNREAAANEEEMKNRFSTSKFTRRRQPGKGPSRGMNFEEKLMLIIYAVLTVFLWLHLFVILPYCQFHWENEPWTDDPSPTFCQNYYGSSSRGRHHPIFFIVVVALYALSLVAAFLSPVRRYLAYNPLMLSARGYVSHYASASPSVELRVERYDVDRCCGLCAYKKHHNVTKRTDDLSVSFSRVHDDTITFPAVDSFSLAVPGGDAAVESSWCCCSKGPMLIRLRTLRHVEPQPSADSIMNDKLERVGGREVADLHLDVVGGEGDHRGTHAALSYHERCLESKAYLVEDYHLAYATEEDDAHAPMWSSCMASQWLMWFFAGMTLGPFHHVYFYLRTVSVDIDVVKSIAV